MYALPIVNSARTKRGLRERERKRDREGGRGKKKRRKTERADFACKKRTRWHSYRTRGNESEYMEACTNERTIWNQILSLTRSTTRQWWGKAEEEEPFLGALRQDTNLLGATVSGPFEREKERKRAGPLVSSLPSRVLARTKSVSRALNAV